MKVRMLFALVCTLTILGCAKVVVVKVDPPKQQGQGLTPEQAQWLVERFVPHPGRALTDPVRLTRPLESQPATYVVCRMEHFDERLKAMKPRVSIQVPNTLTGEGNLPVTMTFESMDDFTPGQIARKIEPLRKLLEARTQLANLITYMDGKTGAEELIANVLRDPTLLQALASAPKPAVDGTGSSGGTEGSKS